VKLTIDDKELIFTERVKTIFKFFRQDSTDKNEAGGILLGQLNKDSILITRASIPNRKDNAGKYSFVRDKTMAQLIIDYEFANSGGRTLYLGEWHTHPENVASPSSVDKLMIHEQFEKNKIHTTFLLLVILGLKKDYISIYEGKKLKILSKNKL